jgi:epoxyqueuosine reductase QueG
MRVTTENERNDNSRKAARHRYLRRLSASVFAPVWRGISKSVCWHASQSVCPWNVRFSQELKEPAFAAREVIAGTDARTLAREILAMNDEDFRIAFKGSPMKRAKLRGLKRNAAIVLGNAGAIEDVPTLVGSLNDPEPLVSAAAAWALARIATRIAPA